jgi:hypothetical protein
MKGRSLKPMIVVLVHISLSIFLLGGLILLQSHMSSGNIWGFRHDTDRGKCTFSQSDRDLDFGGFDRVAMIVARARSGVGGVVVGLGFSTVYNIGWIVKKFAVNATSATCIGVESASSRKSTVDSLIVRPGVYTCVSTGRASARHS